MKNQVPDLDVKRKSIIILLSIISFSIGLIYSLVLIVKGLLFNFIFTETQVKLVIILITAGLLGSALDFVLKGHIEKFIKKFVEDEKLESLLFEVVSELEIKKEEEKIRFKEEEKSKEIVIDTVIVPVASSYDYIIKNKKYKCLKEREFKKEIKYIAFYMNKEVVSCGEILGEPYKDGNDIIYKLDNIVNLDIPHLSRGPFVQNKIYCQFKNLVKAKNTDEIRP